MAKAGKRPTRKRKTLTRERVLEAAVELADRDGLESLSMRNLGGELGVDFVVTIHVRGLSYMLAPVPIGISI